MLFSISLNEGVMMNNDLSYYLSLFPGASRNKPRFMALAEAVLRQATDLIALIAQLQSGFSFAFAEGVQLDMLAAGVGLKRNEIGSDVSDEAFRQYVLAKLSLWTWDGTNKKVTDVLDLALAECCLDDNEDGSVAITANGEIPVKVKELLPVPAGIEINLNSQ